MDIEGDWEGYYEYGYGYTLPMFGERVQFKANFQGSNDEFTGSSFPIKSEYSVDLESTIRGYMEDDFISFVKTYAKKPIFKTPGSSEITIEEGELELEYVGYLDLEKEEMYGKWSLFEIIKDELGELEYTFEGIWFLRKVKS